MSDLFPVPNAYLSKTKLTNEQYLETYRHSITDNEDFWRSHGQRLDWFTPYTKVKDVSYHKDDLHIRWYEDGTLNVSYNCIDRHLPERANQTAIIWEGDDPSQSKKVSFQELHDEVCRPIEIECR